MTAQQAFRICYKQKYHDFRGRSSRSEYWWFYLTCTLVSLTSSILAFFAGFFLPFNATSVLEKMGVGLFVLILLAFAIYCVSLIIPMIAATCRRLRDAGFSQWWWLVNLIPSLGGLTFLILLILPSKSE